MALIAPIFPANAPVASVALTALADADSGATVPLPQSVALAGPVSVTGGNQWSITVPAPGVGRLRWWGLVANVGGSTSPVGPGTVAGDSSVPLPPQSDLAVVQQILTSLYAARASMATQAFVSVTIDGQATVFNSPGQLDQQILFWERKVAFLSGRRRRMTPIRLG